MLGHHCVTCAAECAAGTILCLMLLVLLLQAAAWAHLHFAFD
jgi:hypothetical protein